MVLRQLPAATSRSSAAISNCTNFSASANVVADTSGPTAGPVPNAGGAPGGRSAEFCPAEVCPAPREPLTAPSARSPSNRVPSTPRDVTVKNCLRDFPMNPPRRIVALDGSSFVRRRFRLKGESLGPFSPKEWNQSKTDALAIIRVAGQSVTKKFLFMRQAEDQ